MSRIVQKAKVLATATVTWLVFAATVLSVAAEELADVDGAGMAAAWCLRIVAWIGAAVAILRRVSPVAPDQRGILPTSEPS